MIFIQRVFILMLKLLFSIISSFGFIALCILFSGCIGTKFGSATNGEQRKMNIEEKQDVIDYFTLETQKIPTLASRSSNRGTPVTAMAGGVISLATNAVKQMIEKDKRKYTAEYDYALTDLYFYDQLSTAGPFDPIGMQFSGFTLVRTFKHNNVSDTALVAEFVLDTQNPYEIINNTVFRLKLKSLKLNYAKAKVAAGNGNVLNMDFEITFSSSYVNSQGQLFKDVSLGKFFYFLRNAPLDKNAANYSEYYKNLDTMVEGHSFIVPRSFGYHINSGGTVPSFSQGAYNIMVKVKESSKNSFVNQIVIDNSGKLIDALGTQLKSKIK